MDNLYYHFHNNKYLNKELNMLTLFQAIRDKVFGKKPEPAVVEAPYKIEAQPPVVTPDPVTVVTPAPAPELVGKPADDRVEATAPAKPKKAKRAPKPAEEKLKVEVNSAWEGAKTAAKKPRAPKPKAETKLKVVTADTNKPKKKPAAKKK